MAARYPTSSGLWARQILERIVAGKEKRAEEASKEMIETGRVLRLAKTRVEAAEMEVSGMEQHQKEARMRITSKQEKAARASMEQRETLVRRF